MRQHSAVMSSNPWETAQSVTGSSDSSSCCLLMGPILTIYSYATRIGAFFKTWEYLSFIGTRFRIRDVQGTNFEAKKN